MGSPFFVFVPLRWGGMGTSGHRALFLSKFLRHGTRIASVTPSSRWMCRELARGVDGSRPQRILELGAGTGVVTREIERRMHAGSTVVAYEPDADFAAVLRRTTGAEVREAGVEALAEAGPDEGGGPFDVVVSGMPVPSFSPGLREALWRAIRTHAPGASYAQLTEIPLIYMRLYTPVFERVRFRAVPLNVPPGGVYHCSGLRVLGARGRGGMLGG